jgi:hypothetical protein
MSEVPRPVVVSRGPRHYAQTQYQAYRSENGGNELTRMSAQLMKARNELDAERRKSASVRTIVEEEQQKTMDAALAVMMTDLLNKQGKTLVHQAKVEAKERDLQYRQARIEQLEVYLSEGQKQFFRQANEEEDGPSIDHVNREHDRRQAELKTRKYIADMEGKLANRLQGLELREAALQMREKQYKALMRSALETEMREKSMPDVEVKLAQVAEIEYNRGYGVGKEAGRLQVEGEAHEKDFLEGYGACYRSQVTLSKVRHGVISQDSPEVDFIFDPAHPHNPYNIGKKLGFLEEKEKRSSSVKKVNVIKKEPGMQKKAEEPTRM